MTVKQPTSFSTSDLQHQSLLQRVLQRVPTRKWAPDPIEILSSKPDDVAIHNVLNSASEPWLATSFFHFRNIKSKKSRMDVSGLAKPLLRTQGWCTSHVSQLAQNSSPITPCLRIHAKLAASFDGMRPGGRCIGKLRVGSYQTCASSARRQTEGFDFHQGGRRGFSRAQAPGWGGKGGRTWRAAPAGSPAAHSLRAAGSRTSSSLALWHAHTARRNLQRHQRLLWPDFRAAHVRMHCTRPSNQRSSSVENTRCRTHVLQYMAPAPQRLFICMARLHCLRTLLHTDFKN